MRVFVTGASGFIGWHLVRALAARGDEVTCLVRKSSRVEQLAPFGVRLAYGDVTDLASLDPAVRGQDAVFHLAGCLRALRAEHLWRVNEGGTRNVARACAEQDNPPALVMASSLASCGPSREGRPRMESDPPQPVSNYGRSKLAGEQAVRALAGRVPITIVRPPIVVGEADPATGAIFAAVSRSGIHVVPTWHNHPVSVIHAADLADLLVLAAERGKRVLPGDTALPVEPGAEQTPAAQDQGSGNAAQGCYFAACGEDPTYADFGRMIGRALGRRRVLVLHVGPAIVWAVAGVSYLISRLRGQAHYFDPDKAREARAGAWTCSAQAAQEELGFRVSACLSDRLRQTADWYRQNGWL